MAYTTLPAAGAKLRASVLSSLITEVRPLYVLKTADETTTANTTLQNDDHLFLPVAANRSYEVECYLISIATGGSTSDLKTAWTFPAGATFSNGGFGPEIGLTPTSIAQGDWGGSPTETSPTTARGFGQTGTNCNILLKGRLDVGATAGTLQLQWAQVVSGAPVTYVRVGSYLKLTPIL